jgi:hypothetical protein
MRNPVGDCALPHVDAAIEPRAINKDDTVRTQTAFNLSALDQLDSLRRDNRSLDLAQHQHTCSADVGADICLIRDRQLRVTNVHVSVHPALDGNVLIAHELAGDDDRWTDGGHGGGRIPQVQGFKRFRGFTRFMRLRGGLPAVAHALDAMRERRLVPEVGIEPTRGVNPTGF